MDNEYFMKGSICFPTAVDCQPAPEKGENRVNQLGGHYTSGRPLSREMRMRIIALSRQGFRQCDISRYMKVTHGCISKILTKYQETGKVDSSENVGRPRVITAEIERKVKEYWATDPGLFCWEIRERLLREEICQEDDVPSLSSLSRLVKENMMNKSATETREKEEMMAEESAPKAVSYTAFTIASILGMNSEEKGALGEEESGEKSAGQKDSLVLKQQTRRRKRTTFTPIQVYELEREFRRSPYPGNQRRDEISKKLHISEVKTQVWFANRRARGKRFSADLKRDRSGTADIGKSLCSLSQDKSLFDMGMPYCSNPRLYFLPSSQKQNFNFMH